jgi:hypothetical protein
MHSMFNARKALCFPLYDMINKMMRWFRLFRPFRPFRRWLYGILQNFMGGIPASHSAGSIRARGKSVPTDFSRFSQLLKETVWIVSQSRPQQLHFNNISSSASSSCWSLHLKCGRPMFRRIFGYSDWLRAGRPRGRISSHGMVKNILFPTSFRPAPGALISNGSLE